MTLLGFGKLLAAAVVCVVFGTSAVAAGVNAEVDKDTWELGEEERLMKWPGYRRAKDGEQIVYVGAGDQVDFEVDGSADQVEINQALQHVAGEDDLGIVHLNGGTRYSISDTIRIPGDTVLQGDADAVVELVDDAQWPKWKPMIATSAMAPTQEVGVYTKRNPGPVRRITIRGFEMDANKSGNSGLDKETGDRRRDGQGYDYMIMLINAYEVTINNMYLHDMLTDAVVVRVGSGRKERDRRIDSRFFENRIERIGHDGFYIQIAEGFEIYDNYVYDNETNSHIRVSCGNNYRIYNNELHNSSWKRFSGNAGIQVQNGRCEVDDVEIYGNTISRMGLGGIIVYGARTAEFGKQRGFEIHHNAIYDSRIAGIRLYGAHETVIANNVLYGNRGDGILHWYVYGTLPEHKRVAEPPKGGKYRTIVRDNIISNTVLSSLHGNPDGRYANRVQPKSGFALNNSEADSIKEPEKASDHLTGLHEFVTGDNCLHNNISGPYNNVGHGSKTGDAEGPDIHEDPMFVDAGNGDFRLKPGSPCEGKGIDGMGRATE